MQVTKHGDRTQIRQIDKWAAKSNKSITAPKGGEAMDQWRKLVVPRKDSSEPSENGRKNNATRCKWLTNSNSIPSSTVRPLEIGTKDGLNLICKM